MGRSRSIENARAVCKVSVINLAHVLTHFIGKAVFL